MEKFSQEQWEKIEGGVNEAEKSERKARRSSRELFKETGMTKTERGDAGEEKMLEKSSRKRVAGKAMEREEFFEREASDILGEEGSPERALVGLRRGNIISAMRENRALENQRMELLDEESDILRGVEEEPSGAELEALEEVREELAQIDGKEEKLAQSSPEAYFGLHLKEMKEYKEDLEKGRIVETPYVKKQAEDITTHLRAGKPVMLYGHLGSGKTELAMHVAREYMGKEALVISGSKHTSLAELYGHQILFVDKINKEELDGFADEVEQKYEEWVKENPKAKEEEKGRAHDRILQTYLTQFKGGTISDFFLGPVYRAMAEGRLVIVDEVNAIPHEVLISLNHILTRKVGEKINVQQNTGTQVEVKDGFGVMMTGNLNQGQEKYIERQDMDPAFLSRLYKLEYDYLPQKTDGSLEEEAGKANELFHLLIAEIMDKNGNIEAPEDSIKKLWNLAKAARVTQDVFAGREVDGAYYFKEAGGRAAKYLLKESVMSIRAIENILEQWKEEGYEKELDHYIWKEFVSQSTVASDRAYLYQILQDQFGFFQSEGWEQNPDYGSGGMINVFDVSVPENKSAEKKFFEPRDVVESAFGSPPERSVWPDVEKGIEGEMAELSESQNIEELEEMESFRDLLEKDIEEIGEEVEEFCKV